MTLEEEIINKAGNAMAREIDREVLWGMLKELGWIRVMLPNPVPPWQAAEIIVWVRTHCKNAHEQNGRDFLFEDAKDANWFILRWGAV
jgi:hypothetical protein